MDSFFSLFDPTDGAGKSDKTKGDTPKGRRRGRKCSGKSETLPEESSFLCEPDLSTEMLVKDGSYIDCYYRDEKSDSRQDNTKMRRRNSGRKSRRKKSKVSPANDLARDGWSETDTAGPTTEGGLVAETGGFVTEAGGFVAENGGLVKETGGFGKETGGFVTENGGFVTEKIRLAIETGGHVNETGGFVNKIRGFVTEIRGFVTETGRFATEIEGPDHQETDAGIPVKDTSKCKTKWNNRSTISKNVGNIGKNVNDLKKETDSEFKTCKRKNSCDSNSTVTGDVGCKAINNVIDKLERVGLKDDMYLAGDFNTDDLENDGFSSSEDYDESYDDSTSESDSGSADEVYGSLPPEPRFGNVEYKLQLVNVCEKRFQHLVTQLKWRLRSGGGLAVYLVGVSDCGALRGLRASALRASVRTLRAMGATIGARILSVTARRVREQRAVAEVILRKLPHSQQSELRVAVMGADEAGKSTLIGVLTQGELDNGRGSARLNMFRHLHEVRSGRTSSLSHEILGFDAQGNVVNYGCSELMTAERIGERSAKLVSFLDLAGHSKYQRTTLHGLTGYCPHYAMLVISATAGITSITEEHIGVLLALDLPFFCVITKCELAPPASAALTGRLGELLAPAGKKPLLITNEQLARSCVAQEGEASTTDHIGATVAVFPVSCVLGTGLSALHAALLELRAPSDCNPLNFDDEACEFQIDEIFHVGESSGPVVGGLLASGTLREGDSLLLGPMESGSFVRTCVRSIYRNRVPHSCVGRGQSASLGLPEQLIHLRPGMVLLSIPKHYQSADYEKPSFGGCAPGTCRRKAQATLQPHLQIKSFDNSKNIKNVRRKNKNIIQDIAKAEKSLVKIDPIEDSNLYKSDSEKNDRKIIKKDIYNEVPDKNTKATDINTNMTDKTDINIIEPDINGNTGKSGDNVDDNVGEVKKCEQGSEITEECQCRDEVLLEDPNDPRGCMFFQASIHVLRHSTAICPGFQCTVHVGNVRQTAIIEGILTCGGSLRCGQSASCLVRWARCPEYLARGRRLLLTAGGGTRAIGRITQIFPYVP